jgi:recombinational DNA repair protein (RecF pathway)
VTGSLLLDNFRYLTSLEELENVPEIFINSCPKIVDFTGLGNHKKLTVCGNSVFEVMLKEFQTKKRHSALFESVEHLYFHSKSSSTQKCIW